MESNNAAIELWRHPKTGVALPFVDARLVAGRVERSDCVVTYLRGQVGGRPCLVQAAYPRWSGSVDWVVPSVVDDTAVLNMELSFPVALSAPASASRSRLNTAVLSLALILLGIVWVLHRLWSMLAGGR